MIKVVDLLKKAPCETKIVMEMDILISPQVTWIFIFIVIYWLYPIFWGIKGALSSKTTHDYFLAGRQLPFWVFIFAITAVTWSGWTFLGSPGQTYVEGLQYTYAEFLSAITMPFAALLFLKRQWLLGKRFGFITPGEMFAYYFKSDLIRLLVVIVALVFTVPYVGLQLRAAGFLFNVLTNGLIGVEFGMWVLSVMVVSYVASGGLRTAAYAGALQAILLAAGIIVIGIITLYFVGGWSRLLDGIAALSQQDTVRTPNDYSHYIAVPGVIQLVSTGPEAEGGPWTGMMILTYTFAMMGIMAAPAFSMWAFASRTPAPFAPQQVWASSLGMGLIVIFFTTIQGLGGHFLGADRWFMEVHPELVNPVMVEGLNGRDLLAMPDKQDILVPQLINLIGDLAPWVVGLLAVSALAAMESTASCYMSTTSGIFTRDVFQRFILPTAQDSTQKFVGRISVLMIVMLAVFVASTATDTLVLLGGLAVSYGFQMWPALIAICYWPFLTRQGVALGLLAGLIAVTLTEAIGPKWLGITAWGRWPLTIHSAGWGIIFNLGIAVLVSLVTQHQDDWRRKMEFHHFLGQHARLPAPKQRLVPWAWTMVILWFSFAVGPGVVIGNTLFGNPNQPEDWWFGMPSIWVWQILWWLLGVALMWFLAYYMEMSTVPRGEVEPLVEDIAQLDNQAKTQRNTP